MVQTRRIFIAGHRGMAGAAITRKLRGTGDPEIITRSREELDLTDQAAVMGFFAAARIDEVYLAAAKVGGIYANDAFPAEFIYRNLMIEANVIHASFTYGVRKVLFLGSSCIYPRMASQPMTEDALLTGPLEPTNEPYAIAKIAGIKLCESYNRQYGKSHGIDYRCIMPTNLYGPGDNYHSEHSHVIPALIQRFHEASSRGLPKVTVWGTGRSRREFLFVDDMAAACVHLMNLDKTVHDAGTSDRRRHVNAGSGEEVTIAELVRAVARMTGFMGDIVFDTTKPDGAPRKMIDSSLLRDWGWEPKVDLEQGLEFAYEDFIRRNVAKEL